MNLKLFVVISLIHFLTACSRKELHQVSVNEFREFVECTGYITDAERFGSTFIQNTVFDYEIAKNVNWRKPNGIHSAIPNHPVTQVSYNDAEAFCKWKGCSLPSYQEYWALTTTDKRYVNSSGHRIMEIDSTSIIGNVWELTRSEKGSNEIRLAGGSYLCNATTCNGTDPNRFLTVDRNTSNSHIGFCILINN